MSARFRLLLSVLALLSVFFVGTAGYMMIEEPPDGTRPSFVEVAD